MTWVVDSTVLLNFGKIEAFWIIERGLADPKIVVEEVTAEILHPPIAVAEFRSALNEGWLQIHRAPSEEVSAMIGDIRQQLPRLGMGEAASLSACLLNGWALVSDDRDARRVAASRGVPVTGTIGVLLRAVRREVIDLVAAEDVLERMIATGYHAPVSRIADLLHSDT